jgi:glutathione synthase/RimK-type ligase-like ATP-grasp enzyme
MKKKLYISNFYSGGYSTERFIQEAREMNLNCDVIDFKKVSIRYDGGKVNLIYKNKALNLKNAYLMTRSNDRIIKPLAAPLGLFFSHFYSNKTRIFNGESIVKYPFWDDKLYQHKLFGDYGIPTIEPTYFFSSSEQAERFFKKKPIFPVIKKPRLGAKGKGIEVAMNQKQLDKILFYNDISSAIFQKFISHDYYVRVLVDIDGIIGAIKRFKTDKLVSKSKSGRNEVFEVNDKHLISVCLKLRELWEADCVGIDMICDENSKEFMILEVNRFPGFKGFEMATGINVARRMLELLLNK